MSVIRLFPIILLVTSCVGSSQPTTTTTATTVPQPSSTLTTLETTTTAVTSTVVESTTTTSTEPPDQQPPELAVSDPADGATVSTETYRFRGTTEPGATVQAAGKFDANVQPDGSWDIILVLRPGGNRATFTATDGAGNQTVVHVAVTYCPNTSSLGDAFVPQVTFTPRCGPVGTRVHFQGDGFTDPFWDSIDIYGLISQQLYQGGNCELIVDLSDAAVTNSADGHVEGGFVIGSTGGCFQEDPTPDDVAVPPGLYLLSLNCHVCDVGAFYIAES